MKDICLYESISVNCCCHTAIFMMGNLYCSGFTCVCHSSQPSYGRCRRYVDDICTAMEEYSIEEFQDHLNLIEPSIKFTSELESEGKLAFPSAMPQMSIVAVSLS